MLFQKKHIFMFIFILLFVPMIFCLPADANKKIDGINNPMYPPRAGEFYPTSPQKFPDKVENPYANARTIPFTGGALEIFLQTDMVTQIQFPSAPLLVNIGKAEGFAVEVVPEFHSLFVKPLAKVEMTNLIVTTERGVYTFMLKENPWKPFDMRVVVTDPYRNVQPDDTRTLLWMAYYGVRPPEFQFHAMEIRNLNASQYIYDPVTKMGSKVTMQRAVALPKNNKSVYWVEFMNVVPPEIKMASHEASFMVDERSVWTQYLAEVAVPGTQSTGIPMLSRGDKVDMFLICETGIIPTQFRMRYMMQGSPKNLPVEVIFAMNTTGKNAAVAGPGAGAGSSTQVLPASESVDERLRRLYEQQLKKTDIPTYEEHTEAGKNKQPASPSTVTPPSQTKPTGPATPGKPGGKDNIFFIEP